MNISVCFRILREFDNLTLEEWKNMSQDGLDFSFIKKVINPYDEGALEAALRLKDVDSTINLTAITVISESTSYFYKTLLAIGFDNVVEIVDENVDNVSSIAIANILSSNLEQADIVLMGAKCSDYMSSMIPYYVANKLNYEIEGNVIALSIDNGELCVENQVLGGTEYKKAKMKTVFAFGNARYPYLRMPTLREKLNVKDKTSKILEVNLPEISTPEMLFIEKRRSNMFLEKDTFEDNMEELKKLIVEGCNED